MEPLSTAAIAAPDESGSSPEEAAPLPGGLVPELETSDGALVDALPAPHQRERRVGDHGFVRLVDAMPRLVQPDGLGPEAAVVQAARVSYGAGTKTTQSDEQLLRYLLRHNHMTPFEMITLKFLVRAPKFTAMQWMRHRAGSFNEASARYSVVASDFYIPEARDIRAQSTSNRQGSDKMLDPGVAELFQARAAEVYRHGMDAYGAGLEHGVAREMARIVLPAGMYTTYYWTVNLRNLFGFLELRMASDAQQNIREYATLIHELLNLYCPVAVRAFDDYRLGSIMLSTLEIRAFQTGFVPVEMSPRERAEWVRKRALLVRPTEPDVPSAAHPAPEHPCP